MAALVALSEIKSSTIQLFEALEARGVTHAKVPNSQYWTVSLDAFDIDQPEPTLGNVWDDLDDLKRELAPVGEGQELTAWHAFHHLSGLIQLISNADNNGELLASERNSG